ncbi:hypothetical protein [Fuerstiella marisgermanici]|uniref:Uncharacterized protein n=1 Tax=Fuerstiella marisgermanici TaxID=1891926 RepID=A0A1P8WBS4_9PLAN|nr:hypothetical protein [Fuerstiella marisgermanici]APZ91518.1 hypothetical protein Fuma_01106 [Fuerstiella marisgermanici]
MSFSSNELEQQLLETSAGQAVYDSLVQANVNLCTVSAEMVKQMLVAECKYRQTIGYDSHSAMAVC